MKAISHTVHPPTPRPNVPGKEADKHFNEWAKYIAGVNKPKQRRKAA